MIAETSTAGPDAPDEADAGRFHQSARTTGRDDSAAVSAALDRAVAGRATRLTICGAVGSGRTQLVEHARRDAQRVSMRVLATHGRTGDADIPFASLLTLLHPVADRIGELPTTERDSLLAALDLRDADVDGRAARTGLWRLLTRLGEERPLLVTVDDSDLMDEPSLDLLAFALGRMDAQPVAAVATADCHRSSNPLVQIGDELIVLDGLDVESVVRSVQASVPATDWVTRRIASFAGGNAAVAIQLARTLTADQRAGRTACPAVPVPPPDLVRPLLPVLDQLTETSRRALAVIAADTTDDVHVVRTALRSLGHDGDTVAELEQRGLLAVVGATVRVRRPVLEVVAYDRLEPADRRAVHRALAAAMSAAHLDVARAWQLASGADGPDDKVAVAMLAVARSFAGRGQLRAAAVAFERAADFTARHDDRSRALHGALGCWTALGEQVAARRLLDEPLDDCVATHVARSAAVRWLDGDSAAVNELRAAAGQATERERALLDALFADAALASGRVGDAVGAARRVLQRGDRGPARNLAEALLVLAGQATPAQLSPPATPAGGDEAMAIVAARATLRQAEVHLRFGDAEAAELALGGSEHDAPPPWDPAERAAARGRVLNAQGQPAAAQRLLATAAARLPGVAPIARAVLDEVTAEAQFLLGDGEAAMATLDATIPVLHAVGLARAEASAQRTLGRIAWSVGETDVAVACLERARRLDVSAPMGDLVVLLTALGRDADARAWLARIDARPREPTAPVDVLRARCNAGADPAAFDRLAETLRRGHAAVAEAELLIDLAAWHHRRNRWSDVLDAAERAARLLVPSGLRAWIDRLDRLEPPPDAPVGNVPEVLLPLTDAERRVALAVSRGLTNKEVAGQLFVSSKTIDSHLQRIYPKLQIRSRAELAARVNGALAAGAGFGRRTGDPSDAGR